MSISTATQQISTTLGTNSEVKFHFLYNSNKTSTLYELKIRLCLLKILDQLKEWTAPFRIDVIQIYNYTYYMKLFVTVGFLIKYEK